MNRALKYVFIGGPVLIALLIVSALWQSKIMPRAFASIRPGDSEAKVLSLMGRPYQVERPPRYVGSGHNPPMRSLNTGEWARALHFNDAWTVGVQTFVVGLDGNSNVVSTYSLSSP